MRLGSFIRVMSCMKHVGMGGMCMMGRFLTMTCRVVPGRLFMMLHGVLMMLGGLHVMAVRRVFVVRWFLGHVFLLLLCAVDTRLLFRSPAIGSIAFVSSDLSHQHQDDDDDQDEADDPDAAVTEAITIAAKPATEAAQQENNKDDDKDCP
jgi:hypothetical protein